ncbi:MAG: SMP-30/gluconolactonase/LRE family protein [Gemmatimonadaceae bacterium]
MRLRTVHVFMPLAAVVAAVVACASTGTPAAGTSAVGGSTTAVKPWFVRDGFVAPEAVRYDPDQDVYFVGNWGPGPASRTDNNGYISRMKPDGQIETLKFIAGGTNQVVLHAPRGMYIVGDTLWVADADAVRGFNRRTGDKVANVDFSGFDRGFLNDVAADATGTVYVTDTGRNKLYRVQGPNGPTVVVSDSALGSPNGITWDAANNRFIIVPYGGYKGIRAWVPGATTLTDAGMSTGAKYDGVEVLPGGRVLVSSQADSSLHLFSGSTGHAIIHTLGAPADIAVDTKRNRVAVPVVALNHVEIYELPK